MPTIRSCSKSAVSPPRIQSGDGNFQNGGTVILQKADTTTATNATRFILINSGYVKYNPGVGSIIGGTYGNNAGQNNAVTINGQGILDVNGSGSINSSIGILSVGSFANAPQTGTFGGAGTDFGNGTILNSALTTATLSFGSANTAPNSGSANLVQTVFTGNIDDGNVVGGGTLALVKLGTGTSAFATAGSLVGGAGNTDNGGSFNNGSISMVVTHNPGNTFSGGLYITAGSVYSASDNALGIGTLGMNGGTLAAFGTPAHTFANPVSLLGGTSQIGDTVRNGPLTFTGNVFLIANGTLNVLSPGTFNGTMAGTFNFIKGGASTLTLAGSNTYTGTTTVNAGTLAIASSIGSTPAVIVNSTGSLTLPGGFSTPSTLTIAGAGGVVVSSVNHSAGTISPGSANAGNFSAGTVSFAGGLSLGGGATFIDLNGAATTGSDEVIVSGGALNMASGAVAINFLSAPTGLPKGPYTIATYTSKTGAMGNLTFNSRANISTADTGSAIQVTVNSYTAGNLTWNGTASSAWDLSTTANWTNAAGASDKFFQLDNVALADITSTPVTVNVSTFVAPGSIIANNSLTNYTISGTGVIGGTGALTKTGTGQVTMSSAWLLYRCNDRLAGNAGAGWPDRVESGAEQHERIDLKRRANGLRLQRQRGQRSGRHDQDDPERDELRCQFRHRQASHNRRRRRPARYRLV